MILRPFYMCAVLSAIAVLASAQTEKQLKDTHDEKLLNSLVDRHATIGDDKDTLEILIQDQNSNCTSEFRNKRSSNRYGSRTGGRYNNVHVDSHTQNSNGGGSRSIYATPPPRNRDRIALTTPRSTSGKTPRTDRPRRGTTSATPPPRNGKTSTTVRPNNGRTSTTHRPINRKTSTTSRPEHDPYEDDYEYQPSPNGQNDNGDGTKPPQSNDYEQTSSDNQNNDDSHDPNDGQDQSDGSTNYLADDSLLIPEALIRDPLVVKEQARHYFQRAFIGVVDYWPDNAIEHIMLALSYRKATNVCVRNADANCEETGKRYVREYRESGENCWKKYGEKSESNDEYSEKYLNQYTKCNDGREEIGEENLLGYKNCLENFRLDSC